MLFHLHSQKNEKDVEIDFSIKINKKIIKNTLRMILDGLRRI